MDDIFEELLAVDYRDIKSNGVTKFKTFTVVSWCGEYVEENTKGEAEDENIE